MRRVAILVATLLIIMGCSAESWGISEKQSAAISDGFASESEYKDGLSNASICIERLGYPTTIVVGPDTRFSYIETDVGPGLDDSELAVRSAKVDRCLASELEAIEAMYIRQFDSN